MPSLRLGNPDSFNQFSDNEDEGNRLYLDAHTAMQRDVLGQSQPQQQPTQAQPNFNLGGSLFSQLDSLQSKVSGPPQQSAEQKQPGLGGSLFDSLESLQQRTMPPPPEPKKPGLDLTGSAKKGFKGLMVTWDYLANRLEKAVTGGEDDTKDTLAKSAEEYQKLESDPRIAELVEKGNKAENTAQAVKDMLGFAVRNPTMIANFLAEQVPGMVVGGGLGAAVTAPARAAAVNLATRAGASAAASEAVGMGVTGAGINMSATALQSLGSNYTDGLKKFEGDTEKASQYAVDKTAASIPANAVAGMFLGLSPFASKVANVALQSGIQGTGGAVSALQSAAAVGEEVGRGELIMQFLGQAASAPIDLFHAKFGGKTVEETKKIVDEKLATSDGKDEIWNAMQQDERISKALEKSGITGPDDPNFDAAIRTTIGTLKRDEFVRSVEPKSQQDVAQTTQERGADVQAAFGETASTGTGIGTGATEPVIKRESVVANNESKTLEPIGAAAEPVVLPEGKTTPAGTMAMAPEDIVSRQQGFEVQPAFQIGDQAVSNRFVTKQQAETFLFGPVDKKTGVRNGGYASSVADMEFQIRQGKRSKDAGGGTFYFIEGREKPLPNTLPSSEVKASPNEPQAPGGEVAPRGRSEDLVDRGDGVLVPRSQIPRITEVDLRAHEAATSPLNRLPAPTDAQKESGNYKKGHVKVQGLDIAIENPAGSKRNGTSPEGKVWETEMQNHYGYIKGSVGKDKDHVDVFVGPSPESKKVFVVDQVNKSGSFDEHKALIGFNNQEEARLAYLSNFEKGWTGLGAISEMPIDAFKSWVKDGEKRNPLAYQEPKQEKPNATEVRFEQQGRGAEHQGTDGGLRGQRQDRQQQTGEQASRPETGGGNRLEQGGSKQQAPVKESTLWSYNKVSGLWESERKVTSETKDQWLAQFRKDEPEKTFVVSDKKPAKPPAKPAAEKKSKQAEIDKTIGAKKADKQEVIELWEDNDDGKAAHITWKDLPEKFKNDWREAVEDNYATIDLHDKLVQSATKTARAERTNAKFAANAEANRKDGIDGNSIFRESVAGAGARGVSVESAQRTVDKLVGEWTNAPEIKVVQSESELPAGIRAEMKEQRVEGKISALYNDGQVYIIADNNANQKVVVLSAVHEAAGHHGLRMVLGKDYAKVMNDIYNGNSAIRKAADKGIRNEGLTREIAVEEALVDILEAHTKAALEGKTLPKEQAGVIRSLMSAIRKFLRDTFGIAYVSNKEVMALIDSARRHVVDGDVKAGIGESALGTTYKASAPTFYSKLEREVRSVKLNKDEAAPDEWKGIINNKLKQSGVKQEEIDYIGVNDWLTLQKGKVARQQVLDFISGNRLHLNDIILEGAGRRIEDEQLREMYADREGIPYEDVPIDMSRQDLLDAVGLTERMAGGTKHGDEKLNRVLPGGKSQFELVLADPSAHTKPYKSDDSIHFGDVSGGKAIGWIRGNIRKDATGNQVLFLEELQSQRGQQGREHGFEKYDITRGKDGEWVLKGGSLIETYPSSKFSSMAEAKAWAERHEIRHPGVPTAPFVEDTKAWTGLLLKRAIAYAQEKGLDRIAWTTGEQQNARYDLRREVDTVYSGRNNDGTWEVSATKDGVSRINKSRVAEKDLPNIVGKEMAKAIVDSGDGMKITGDDLVAFQSDLRPYYDTTVPSVAGKIIEKFGGKVEPMKIEGTGEQLGFVVPDRLRETVASEGLPLFRRNDYEAQYKDLPENVREMAIRKGHYSPPSIRERLAALQPRFNDRLIQGVFDRYHSIKDLGKDLYIKARLSNGSQDGAVATMLNFGQVIDDGGALNYKKGTKGLIDILKGVGPETDRFLLWMAANRAEKLKSEDREKFFTDAEIKELKRLNLGTMDDGKSRPAQYIKALQEMNEMNRSVLDIAKQKGLITEEAYKRFSADIWYVPFYRNMEDNVKDGLAAAQISSRMTGQKFSDKLKGSERPLNDLLENVLLNWSHILSASMKNGAAHEILNSAVNMGAAEKLNHYESGRKDADTVKVMVDGVEQHYAVKDKLLFDSLTLISTLPSHGVFTKIAGKFKSYLTYGVSLSPTFKINNLISDSIQALAVSDLKKNPLKNAMEGWKLYEDKRADALAGGALFTHGAANDGQQAANIRRLTRETNNVFVADAQGLKDTFLKYLDKYEQIGDRAESANRLSLYNQSREKGLSHAEAAFLARDLQDFGLQGSFGAIQWLSSVVPYFNARLQGMYKLGRGYKEDPRRFTTIAGAAILASLALYLGQKDDPDFKNREDWDRDMYWWYKLPGTDVAVRVRKPFELGAISSIVERFTEQIVDKDVEGKVFGRRLLAILGDNLSMNPMPQVFKPLDELRTNQNSFTKRPIETMGMEENRSPENRVASNTSAIAVGLGNANALFADFVSKITGDAVKANNLKLSPVQYDHLIQGYFGWLGAAIQGISTEVANQFKEGEAPAKRIDDLFVVGSFVRQLPQNQSRFLSSFYENAKDVALAAGDYRSFAKAGEEEKALKIASEKGDKLALAELYARVSKELSQINQNIKFVTDDKRMAAADKRMNIDRMNQLKIEYARQVEEARVAIERAKK